jgi:hypothetical protein
LEEGVVKTNLSLKSPRKSLNLKKTGKYRGNVRYGKVIREGDLNSGTGTEEGFWVSKR